MINLNIAGPSVSLGAKSVNFKQIDLGQVGTRTIDMLNNSDVEAIFQVCCNAIQVQVSE